LKIWGFLSWCRPETPQILRIQSHFNRQQPGGAAALQLLQHVVGGERDVG
jgi:hypothetical protein